MRTLLFLAMFFLAACQSTEITPSTATALPDPDSLWGGIWTIAQAEQAHAPALALNRDSIGMSWAGLDEAGLRLYFRQMGPEGLSDTITLPVPSPQARAVSLFPAFAGRYHLLWLDRHSSGQSRLFNILLNNVQRVETGSDSAALRPTNEYAALPLADESVFVVWVGGPAAEPDLYSLVIDAIGRPRIAQRIARNASLPAMISGDDGRVEIFWLDGQFQQVYGGLWQENRLENMRLLLDSVPLNPGDRLTGFFAARDRTHRYLFWNITRLDATDESWIASSSGEEWSAPTRLAITMSEGSFQTGFNSGSVQPAESGDSPLSWLSPAPGSFDLLPAAVNQGDSVGVVYLQAGKIVAYQAVAQSGPLIGLPALLIDRDRHLILAWSQRMEKGLAELKLTTTRNYPDF